MNKHKQRAFTPSKTTIFNWAGNRLTKGFTLVELLVVIAIIALLMSILLPALGKVRKQAKDVLCETNLHQWGTIFAMYADDYDGNFMQGWVPGNVGDTTCNAYWFKALLPYYKDPDLRLCPMATKFQEQGETNFNFSAWGKFPELDRCGECSNLWGFALSCAYGSYGNNAYICNPPLYYVEIQGHPTSNNWRNTRIKGSAFVPMLGDEPWLDCWPHHTDIPPKYEGQPWSDDHSISMWRICINRHDGFVKWVFVDHSVQKLSLRCLWKQKWHKTFDINGGPTAAAFATTWLSRFPPCQ